MNPRRKSCTKRFIHRASFSACTQSLHGDDLIPLANLWTKPYELSNVSSRWWRYTKLDYLMELITCPCHSRRRLLVIESLPSCSFCSSFKLCDLTNFLLCRSTFFVQFSLDSSLLFSLSTCSFLAALSSIAWM